MMKILGYLLGLFCTLSFATGQDRYPAQLGVQIESINVTDRTITALHRDKIFTLRYDSETIAKYGRQNLVIEDLVGAYVVFAMNEFDPELIAVISVRGLPEKYPGQDASAPAPSPTPTATPASAP